jgi:RNA polymerase sigma-70 factor (ECF subfamily)
VAPASLPPAAPAWQPEGWGRLRAALLASAGGCPAPLLAGSVEMSTSHWHSQASSWAASSARAGQSRLVGQSRLAPPVRPLPPRSSDAASERLVALVQLARKGDAEAFGQLYDHYVASIYRYTRARVGEAALAEDLTAETFLRALRAIDGYTWQGRDFGAWLTTIARNLVADHYKSGRVRLEQATADPPDESGTAPDAADTALTGLTNAALWQALGSLSDPQRDCLVLRFLQGLSIAETGLVLGRSEGAVKQLQLRALRSLARALPGDMS